MNQSSVGAESCTGTSEAKDTRSVEAKELRQEVKQAEPDAAKSSPLQQPQPYTTHSFILPASITAVHSNASGSSAGATATSAENVGVSRLGPVPAPASLQPIQQQHVPTAPLAIAPFHGVLQHQHHPIMVAAGPQAPATGATAATLVPAIFMGPAPASFLIPHHAMPAISSLHHQHCSTSKLRSGKWLPEEEEYAMLLVQLFEQGLLTDLEKGTTLRSFLARRLHCAPMRISKKFAGRGIGKMSYAQNNAAFMLQQQQLQTQQHHPGAQQQIAQRLQLTEDKFHRAIFPATAPRFTSPILHDVNNRGRANTPIIPMTTLMAPQLAATAASVLPPFAQLPAVMNVAPKQPIPVLSAGGHGTVVSTPQSFVPNPFQLKSSNPLHTMLQQQQQQQARTPKAPDNNTVNTSQPATCSSATNPVSLAIVAAPTNNKTSTPTITTLATTLQTSTAAAPPATTMLPPQPQEVTTPASSSLLDTTHDLLSGFDKVVQQAKQHLTSSTPATATSIVLEDEPHSPPFTSQSFDDFHRFLGKDLTLLEESTVSATENDDQNASQTPGVATASAPLFVEESYRLLQLDEPPAFRMTSLTTATHKDHIGAPTNELDAIDDVLDAVASEPSLLLQQPPFLTASFHHHRLLASPSRSPDSAAVALVSEDGTNSSDSDTSAEGPVRKKIKTTA